jgi:hypothetical protein
MESFDNARPDAAADASSLSPKSASALAITKADERRAHRAIRRLVGRILLDQLPHLRLVAAEAAEGRATALQASSLRLIAAVPSSREAQEHDAVATALWADHSQNPTRIVVACRRALRHARDLVADAIIDPDKMTPEAAGHGVVAVLYAEREADIDADVKRVARLFDPSIRGRVAATISTRIGERRVVVQDVADLVEALPISALFSPAVKAHAAAGVKAVLKQLGLPRSARNLLPSSIGPIARRSRDVFTNWATAPRFGRLQAKPIGQRRQIEMIGALVIALDHLRLPAKQLDGVIGWALKHAEHFASGRHGRRQSVVVQWIADSLDPDAMIPPTRRWTTGVTTDVAKAAAIEHGRQVTELRDRMARAARANAVPAPAQAAAPGRRPARPNAPSESAPWPASGMISKDISVEHAGTVAEVRQLGEKLANCLRSGHYDARVIGNWAAIYAIHVNGALVGAAALGRGFDGHGVMLIEARGFANAALTAETHAAVARWVRRADADAASAAEPSTNSSEN